MKVTRFNKFGSLVVMMIAPVFLLAHVSLAQVILIAPSKINLGSAKPGDIVESKKKILIELSKEIDVEKVRVTPFEEKDFDLELGGKNSTKIPANYSCREISCNEKAGTICIEVTIKVSEIKWEYLAGKYTGKITIVLSEKP